MHHSWQSTICRLNIPWYMGVCQVSKLGKFNSEVSNAPVIYQGYFKLTISRPSYFTRGITHTYDEAFYAIFVRHRAAYHHCVTRTQIIRAIHMNLQQARQQIPVYDQLCSIILAKTLALSSHWFCQCVGIVWNRYTLRSNTLMIFLYTRAIIPIHIQ